MRSSSSRYATAALGAIDQKLLPAALRKAARASVAAAEDARALHNSLAAPDAPPQSQRYTTTPVLPCAPCNRNPRSHIIPSVQLE